MPATYENIATTTLGSSQANIEFTSIPGTFTDLVIVLAGSAASGGINDLSVQFNGDTTSNYSRTRLLGSGSSATSDRQSNTTACNVGLVDSAAQSNNLVYVFNYANATTNKTVLGRGNAPGGYVKAAVGLWRKTPEAITSIKLTISGGSSFGSGMVATLYGIKAA